MRYSFVLLTIQRNLMCFFFGPVLWPVKCIRQSEALQSFSRLCEISSMDGFLHGLNVGNSRWNMYPLRVLPLNELCLEYHRLIESGDGQQCSSAFIKIIYPTLILPDTYLNQKTMKHLIYSALIVILLVILCMVIIFADANFCKFQFACKGMFLGNY